LTKEKNFNNLIKDFFKFLINLLEKASSQLFLTRVKFHFLILGNIRKQNILRFNLTKYYKYPLIRGAILILLNILPYFFK
jgi:hypothetical protein